MPWGPEVILQIDGHNLWGLSDEAMAADLVSERERERELRKLQNGRMDCILEMCCHRAAVFFAAKKDKQSTQFVTLHSRLAAWSHLYRASACVKFCNEPNAKTLAGTDVWEALQRWCARRTQLFWLLVCCFNY